MKASNPFFPCLALTAAAMALLSGCATTTEISKGDQPRFSAALPPAAQDRSNNGAIYNATTSQTLFEDYKARRVGDILTVVLAEETSARKSAGASSSRTASASVLDPVVAGGPITYKGAPILNTDIDSDQSFEGKGEAAQSNMLEGSITVTVADVLPNGNLAVQGEKWIRINQGEEYIRLRGIVRPVDISAGNTVLSTQVADAELAYGGTGQVAHSSSPGWLSRFFASPIWPF